MHRGGPYWPSPPRAPFGRKESQPWAGAPPDAVRPRLPGRPHRTPPPPRTAASIPIPSHRGVSLRVERIARLDVRVLAAPCSRALFSQHRQMGTPTLASTRGPCGAGGRAFRGLTRSASDWSAARRKPVRAVALHVSATISADVQARSLPTSERRKFPSAEIFDARATLREQSGSTLERRVSAPLRPVCYNEMRNVPIFSRRGSGVRRTDWSPPRSARASWPSVHPSHVAWVRRSCARHVA